MEQKARVRRILVTGIPIVLLGLFIALMTLGRVWKQPMGANDRVVERISDVRGAVGENDWNGAMERVDAMDSAWKKVIPRIQYGVERDELNALDKNIARLRGFIESEDKSGAFSELRELELHWDNLGK